MIDEFIWRTNKGVLRHLDRRVLQLDPAWCEVQGLRSTGLECCLVEEAWAEEFRDVLGLLLKSGGHQTLYKIPMSAILNREIVPDLIKDRPRFWGKP